MSTQGVRMTLRLHVDQALAEGAALELPEAAARHVQVRRLQPGDALHLFDGRGLEHAARVAAMGRRAVSVVVGPAVAQVPELPTAVTLALGVPANERMDTLVEKATELGVAAIQPLECERSVLRLAGERAARRREHWQAVATAASEQCGRAVVPAVALPRRLDGWLAGLPAGGRRLLLSLAGDAIVWTAGLAAELDGPLTVLSGPEGGLAPVEEAAARAAGFLPVSLGPRVLRADTAPLALLAAVALAR
jgi:16S rRNA (uracil1498-N3)-methyltransferase